MHAGRSDQDVMSKSKDFTLAGEEKIESKRARALVGSRQAAGACPLFGIPRDAVHEWLLDSLNEQREAGQS